MERNYYYLISGLPDIVLDSTKKPVSVAEFIDETRELVAPEHGDLLELLRRREDNRNLSTVIDNSDVPFDDRGNYTREFLEQEVKSPDALPGYMAEFIEAHKEGKLPFPSLLVEDQLHWLFYDEITAGPNRFVREWFTFDLNLRNVRAGINSRKLSSGHAAESSRFAIPTAVICRNDVAEAVHRSNAPDFSLSAEYPWVEQVVGQGDGDPIAAERAVDQLRWDMVNDLTTFAYFTIDTVLGFCVKLDMVERWQSLDPEIGRERLERLVTELETGFQFSEDFQ